MKREFDYLIVGGGMAGAAAAVALREVDADASIAILSAEAHPPYDRPPLSKALWQGGRLADIWRSLAGADVSLHLKQRMVDLHRATHIVTDDTGKEWKYRRKLLLATGGRPRKLPFGAGFIYFRTLDDYQRLRTLAKPGAHIAVLGAGFIGSEIAAALTGVGCQITLLFPEEAIGARLFPKGLADHVTAYYRKQGVDVRPGITVIGAEDDGPLQLSDGSTLQADAVVAGLGIVPNVELAKRAGLAVNQGIGVNDHLQTSDPDIYAAGDVAAFPVPVLGSHLRVEHEDAALATGAHAGRCMAGADAPYNALPFFYSDFFDLGWEAVGVLDARLETVEQWVVPYEEGVVYYLEGGRVRGVLLWNTWNQIDAARALIADPGPFDAASVRGRLPQ